MTFENDYYSVIIIQKRGLLLLECKKNNSFSLIPPDKKVSSAVVEFPLKKYSHP